MPANKKPITPTISLSKSSEKLLNVKEPIRIPSAANGTITLRILKSNSLLNLYTAIISENIRIGRMIASACCNGITTVIKGTDINEMEPPKPDFAIPYK